MNTMSLHNKLAYAAAPTTTWRNSVLSALNSYLLTRRRRYPIPADYQIITEEWRFFFWPSSVCNSFIHQIFRTPCVIAGAPHNPRLYGNNSPNRHPERSRGISTFNNHRFFDCAQNDKKENICRGEKSFAPMDTCIDHEQWNRKSKIVIRNS